MKEGILFILIHGVGQFLRPLQCVTKDRHSARYLGLMFILVRGAQVESKKGSKDGVLKA